ncbi:uncharacterized protein LOC131079802 [Cryptomeria japonica]|uniref:uncharacterized protein LOC131079802 n=1 Tax=Cryptomeria japonica TaxID=3369 RepID=UPI0027DA0AA7|nr:uncharacterized protein LOC131079802 [Cryptomeria japonica]
MPFSLLLRFPHHSIPFRFPFHPYFCSVLFTSTNWDDLNCSSPYLSIPPLSRALSRPEYLGLILKTLSTHSNLLLFNCSVEYAGVFYCEFEEKKVLANTEKWFAYQEYSATDDGDGEVSFVLGIQLPEQLDWMLQYGYNNILAMDSTFGTHVMKFQLYRMLVFNSKHMGVLVAWVIMSRSCAHDIAYWMHILLQRVHMKNIEWSLNTFMVDDAGAEIKAIRHAWLKNLIAKVKEIAVRREMFDRLGFIMHHSIDEDSTRNAIHIFIEDFKDTQRSFIE